MAITRGQMQRQLRKGGGIMDVASGTIGGGNYAGIPMGSRTGFGILKKIGRGIRKIIPNEISKVATVAAPFVAPFNPAVAAAMAGIGSFDQTGDIGDAFKRGALTYGGGQLVRGIGGAGFQGNPFNEPLISSPLGTDTGLKLGRFFQKPSDISGISGLDEGALQKTVDKAALKNLSPEKRIAEEAATTFIENQAKANVVPKTVTQLIKEGNYIDAAVEAGKKGTKAIFLDKDGDLDKNVLIAAGAFGLTYADAKKVADDAGVDIGTAEEYDEATKAEKKEEYAGYLTNFFGGKKDGGRIGFSEGADLEQKLKDLADYYMERGLSESEAYETAAKELYKAQGGRIGFRFGDKVKDEEGILSMMDKDKEDEDMDDLMAGGGISFSRAEKSFLFRRLGGAGGASRSYTMPQLYRILSNPNSPSNIGDATILKQIAIAGLGGKKDGGRIGFRSGSNRMMETFRMLEKAIADNDMDLAEELKTILRNEFSQKLAMGGEVPVRKNKAGIEELDYRETGGFVPVGVKEKADDVPAMLSKNEFVLTADAVRGIGGGDVEKGAEKLYGVMKQAEKVGRA